MRNKGSYQQWLIIIFGTQLFSQKCEVKLATAATLSLKKRWKDTREV